MEKLHGSGDRIQFNTLYLYPGSRCCHCPVTQFVLRFLNCLSCGKLGQYLEKKRYERHALSDQLNYDIHMLELSIFDHDGSTCDLHNTRTQHS